jgi:hypothetical protein
MSLDLDRSMLGQRLDQGWTLEGLGARGPAAPWRTKLRLFGQFVGDWEIFPGAAKTDPSLRRTPSGEVHWRWALGGLGTQDVWGHVDPRSRRLVPEGSTIRFYDPKVDAWRSTWLAPYQGVVRRFLGRREGSEIVLRETDRGWRGEHWVFFEVTRSSFRWRAETRSTPHGRWRVTQEYWIRRVPRR